MADSPEHVRYNFKRILSKLANALNGQGDLQVMNYYDRYQNLYTATATVLQDLETFNTHIANDASAYNVPVADVFTAFDGATTPNPNIYTYTHEPWRAG